MGDFTLGCLLGQYDRAQSFDVDSQTIISRVGSWFAQGNQSSYGYSNLTGFAVHSSGQGLRIRTFSHGAGNSILHYQYGLENDVYSRWFPDVTTHDIRASAWFRWNNPNDSGTAEFRILSQDAVSFPIPNVSAITEARLETVVRSQAVNYPQTWVNDGARVDSSELYVDDVLTQIDWITLNPNWEITDRETLIRGQHSTLSGKYRDFIWGSYFAYDIPIRYVSNSHSDLINWWWQNEFNLVLTLDTSDAESTRVCRITNVQQPLGSRTNPYDDYWNGMLRLESIDQGSLVF